MLCVVVKLRANGFVLDIEEWGYDERGGPPELIRTAKVDGVRRDKQWLEDGWSEGKVRVFRQPPEKMMKMRTTSRFK